MTVSLLVEVLIACDYCKNVYHGKKSKFRNRRHTNDAARKEGWTRTCVTIKRGGRDRTELRDICPDCVSAGKHLLKEVNEDE